MSAGPERRDPVRAARAERRCARLVGRLGLRPTKRRGQNFVVDANTVRRVVRLARVTPDDSVVEVGPGLGSLTLALLARAGHVTAVEVDAVLAAQLPRTIADRAPTLQGRLTTVQADALTLARLPDPQPTAFVANLPYNVAVPVLLTFLERFATIERALVMVQLEVAERLAAGPGSRVLWRAERQDGLVGRRAAGGAGPSQRVLAGAQRGLGARVPRAPSAPAQHGKPRGGLRLRRRGVRPTPQDASGRVGVVGRQP